MGGRMGWRGPYGDLIAADEVCEWWEGDCGDWSAPMRLLRRSLRPGARALIEQSR
jgi:hypothetical protein